MDELIKELVEVDTNFLNWECINDSIMGGSSQATCTLRQDGLHLVGDLVEEGGGFVSCRSPVLTPSLDLSKYKGIQLNLQGEGKSMKIGLSCNYMPFFKSSFLSTSLKWVQSFQTNKKNITKVYIPFDKLEPSIRAKKVSIPMKFDSSCITQFQLIYSKFNQPEYLNNDFFPGPINICLQSIYAYY